MNADGKIYIIVTDKLPSGSALAQTVETEKKDDKKEGLFSHWAKQKILNETKQLARTSVMYTLNNIGNFTGNYITQTHINDAMSSISGIISVGMAALAGFKYTGGNPWGAVIGAAIGVISESASAFTSIYSNQVQNRKTNYEIEQLRNRAGLNPLKDGSRGTEN